MPVDWVQEALDQFTPEQLQYIAENHMTAVQFVQAWQNGDFQELYGPDFSEPILPAWVRFVDLEKLVMLEASKPPLERSHGVGQPGLVEGLLPVWGSGRAAIDDFQNRQYFWCAVDTGMAISDVLSGEEFRHRGRKASCKGLDEVLWKRK